MESTYEEVAKHAEVDTTVGTNEMLSRYDAAKIFHDLSEVVDTGHMFSNVSPYVVGRAVHRTLDNNHLDISHNTLELLRGLFGLDEDQCT